MSKEPLSKRRKLLRLFLFRIPILLLVLAVIMIGALKLVEGHPNPLRQGFEEYLSKSTGRNATIGLLTDVKFFPNFIIHAQNITIHNASNAAVVDLELEEIKINSPFSAVFFRNRKINEFSVKNLKSNPGMLSPQEMTIETLEIVTEEGPEKIGSFIVGQGTYNGNKASFESKLDVKKYSYKIPNDMPFSISIGEYEINATLHPTYKNIMLENVVFSKADIKSNSKEYTLVENKKVQADNPLMCLLEETDYSLCDKYLRVEN